LRGQRPHLRDLGDQGKTIMTSHPRPVAPHLQIYRLQLTSGLSLLHRVTGIFLAVGVLALIYWLVAAAASAQAFDQAQALAGSIIGRIMLFLWTGAFFYHLLNGIRHLAWDAIWGYDLPTTYRTGWSVLFGAAVLTLAAWALGYWARGAF
jgi:succinate dehydrogenase / fumarate reductase cytochrome b subunit